MNIGERLALYEERGFDERAAVINVFLEVALYTLFAAFPDTFVCFGGATLVLFFGSSRQSGDLDLLLTGATTPTAQELLDALSTPIAEAANILHIQKPQLSILASGGDHLKLLVQSEAERLFTIDVTRISAVIRSELIDVPLALHEDPAITAKIVSRDLLLLQKAEAFLTRRALKIRDAYDLKLLLDSGAELNEHLIAHLSDGIASERLEDPGFIVDGIAAVNYQKCKAELEPVLPHEVYRELERLLSHCEWPFVLFLRTGYKKKRLLWTGQNTSLKNRAAPVRSGSMKWRKSWDSRSMLFDKVS